MNKHKINLKVTYPNKADYKNIELSNSQIPNKSIQDTKVPLQGLPLNDEKNNFNNRSNDFQLSNLNNIDNNFKKDNSNNSKQSKKSNSMQSNNSKESKLHRFFVNENAENKLLRHKNNLIDTTKYNIFTFLPKALLFQFMRLANVYFLIIAIIQCIPVLSPLSPSTAIAPIAFVLTVSLIREAMEDFSRAKYDKLMNKELALVFRNDSWKEVQSGNLNIGELVLVQEDKSFPSDLILLDSNLSNGLCYIETATLDGEKTLKLKKAENSTAGYFNNGGKWKDKFTLNGKCVIDPPSPELYKLDGKLEINLGDINNKPKKLNIPVDAKQLLLKGAILKNTKWIIGIICYTGHLTKLMLNSKKPRIKFSRVENLMNKLLVTILIMQTIFCIICAMLNSHFYKSYLYGNVFVDYLDYNLLVDSVFKYFTYLLLLNTMIPISLIITLEIVKLIQGFFISFDTEMFSNIRERFVSAKSVSLNEELGQVDYIFSDKTGTLTCNKMNFKYCVIADVCYEFISNLHDHHFHNIDKNNSSLKEDELFRNEYDIQLIGPNQLKNIKKSSAKFDKTSYKKSKVKSESNENVYVNLDTDFKIMEEYLKNLALNNDCVIIDKDKEHDYDYSGLSPDDIELVKAAKNLGCELRKSFNNNEKVLCIAGVEKKFEILNTIEFTSDRKKSSIIVKDGDSYKLYIKGADSMIYSILSKDNPPEFMEQCQKYVDLFSKKGYRTLLVGMRILDEKEYLEWNELHKNAGLNLLKKAEKLDDSYKKMESNIHLLGATIVEDKLQDEVPETIRDLRLAGIKVWMLTGDKIDTAENIAKSCNLISEELTVFKIPGEDFKTFDQFVRKFNEYLIKKQIDLDNPTDASQRMPDYSLIVDFFFLFETFKDLSKKYAFVRIAKYAQSVICSRCSPKQKAEVVKIMKEYDSNLVTLSIGDGGNDVSMIMEAHIGIGVYGEEGMMAVQSSDYAIGEFKMLRRLLLYHGRTNYVRIAEMILYFFYKNFVFTITHFYYAFFNNFSGQTIIDDWFISLYNMIFTALPLISKAIIDVDIKPEDGEIISELLPFIYIENKKQPIFKISSFIFEILRGMLHGLINFFILYFVLAQTPIDMNGNIADIWYFSVNCFTNIVFIVSFSLLISSKYITWYNFSTMFFLSWVLYFIFVYLVNNMSFFNSYATMTVAFSSLSLYLCWILISGITFIIDLSIYSYKYLFKGNLVSLLMREKSKNSFKNFRVYEENNQMNTYQMPYELIPYFHKKEKMTYKNESYNRYNKVNYRDIEKVDRIDFSQHHQDKLILSNNIQMSDNKHNNFNLANKEEDSSYSDNVIKEEKLRSLQREKMKIENNNNNYHYEKSYNHSHNNLKNEQLEDLEKIVNNRMQINRKRKNKNEEKVNGSNSYSDSSRKKQNDIAAINQKLNINQNLINNTKQIREKAVEIIDRKHISVD